MLNHPTIRTTVSRYLLLLAMAVVWIVLPGPVVSADGSTLLQEIKNGADGVEMPNHVTSVVPFGDYVYVGIEYTGTIKCFKRGADGKLTFVSDTVWGGKNDSIELCLAGGNLYGVGGAGHRTGDGDSRGLHWWAIDAKTGGLTEKGNLKVPISRGLVASADGKSLYTAYKQKNTLAHYTLGADGAPTHADDAVFADAKGEIDRLTPAGDGLSLYVMWTDDQTVVVGHARTGAGGALTVQPAVKLTQLTEGNDWPKGKWGFGWGRYLSFSPDGKQAYAEFNNYGDKNRKFIQLDRDPKTGTLAFKADLTDKTTGAMTTLRDMGFNADGTAGWYLAGSESGGDGVGTFTRDPQSGALTFGAAMPETRKSGPCTLAFDAKNKALYIGTWSSNKLFVLKTP